MQEVGGACSGVTEEVSRSGSDTVRARVRQPMTDRHGCDGRTGATWAVGDGGNVEGRKIYGCRVRARREMEVAVSAGKGSRDMVKRGEDERHLPRRGYIGRQTDDRDGMMFCFTHDREQPQGVPVVSRQSFGLPEGGKLRNGREKEKQAARRRCNRWNAGRRGTSTRGEERVCSRRSYDAFAFLLSSP